MKGNPKTKSIPVLVTRTDANPSIREKAIELGADDFIYKPIASEKITPRIRRFLG